MDTLLGFLRLEESLGIIVELSRFGLSHIYVPPKLEQPLVQEGFFQNEAERITGILLCQLFQGVLAVIRLPGRQVLQVRAGRISVADFYVQQTVFLGVGNQLRVSSHAVPENPFEIIRDIILVPGLQKRDHPVLQGRTPTGFQFIPMGFGIFEIPGQPTVGQQGFPIGLHRFQKGRAQGIGRFPVQAGIHLLFFPAGAQEIIREPIRPGQSPDFMELLDLVARPVPTAQPTVCLPLLAQIPGQKGRNRKQQKRYEDDESFHKIISVYY